MWTLRSPVDEEEIRDMEVGSSLSQSQLVQVETDPFGPRAIHDTVVSSPFQRERCLPSLGNLDWKAFPSITSILFLGRPNPARGSLQSFELQGPFPTTQPPGWDASDSWQNSWIEFWAFAQPIRHVLF